MDGLTGSASPGFVDKAVNLASTAISLARVPTAPDGLRDSEAAAPSDPSKQTSLLWDIINQTFSTNAPADVRTAFQFLRSQMPPGKPINDRELLMEHLIQCLAKMPSDSPIRSAGSDAFIGLLWNDLPHPVTSLLSDDYRFRKPDGSYNNLFSPEIGMAGRPYARSVASRHPIPPNLPAPELVFDTLLKRRTFKPHPSGISSFMFAFAVTIVHSIFRTNYKDHSINDASSYLDLSPLYGHNEEMLNKVRAHTQGRLLPDVVAEDRLFLMPASVTALLVLFNRHHNFLADQIYRINENGKYKDPSKLSDEDKKKQDDELFGLARNINCAFFTKIIVSDYVGSILGTNQIDTDWHLDPLKEINGVITGKVARACGNTCTVEFNMLYRWHATLSEADTEWMEDEISQMAGVPKDKLDTLDSYTFLKLAKAAEDKMLADKAGPTSWNVPGLKRNSQGYFNDDELANIIQDAIERPAGAFRANGIPGVMKPIDVLGIKASRDVWHLCTMNEFREFFNLSRFESFLDWNSDPEVAAAAEKLYGHIDNLELYPGLLAEAPKPGPMLGSGLAVNHTISRAILSDAVALTRGDRFLTTDYGTATLTKWGMEYLTASMADGAKGNFMCKLLLRTLPQNFTYNSSYSLFPFQTPASMEKLLTKQGLAQKYSFTRPVRQPDWKCIKDAAAADQCLKDHVTFGVIYTAPIESLSPNNYGFLIGFDQKAKHDDDRFWMDGVVFPKGYEGEYKKFYTDTVRRLIKENSWQIPGTNTICLDFCRDVSRMASVYWMAELFGIPLKTKDTPLGLITPQDLFMATAAMFIYIFMDFDGTASFKIRDAALTAGKLLSKIFEARILEIKGLGWTHILDGFLNRKVTLATPGPMATAMYKRLIKAGRSMDVMISQCIGIITASSQNQSQAAAQILNLYLKPEYAEHVERMNELAQSNSPESEKAFLMYSWEAQRIDPQTPAIPRFARRDIIVQDGPTKVNIKQGDRVFIDLRPGMLDPQKFPNPLEININRPLQDYRIFGFAMHNCLGSKIVDIAQPILLKEVMKLKNLKRAPGTAGQLARFEVDFHGTPINMYLSPQWTPFPFPNSMSIYYDI